MNLLLLILKNSIPALVHVVAWVSALAFIIIRCNLIIYLPTDFAYAFENALWSNDIGYLHGLTIIIGICYYQGNIYQFFKKHIDTAYIFISQAVYMILMRILVDTGLRQYVLNQFHPIAYSFWLSIIIIFVCFISIVIATKLKNAIIERKLEG